MCQSLHGLVPEKHVTARKQFPPKTTPLLASEQYKDSGKQLKKGGCSPQRNLKSVGSKVNSDQYRYQKPKC